MSPLELLVCALIGVYDSRLGWLAVAVVSVVHLAGVAL